MSRTLPEYLLPMLRHLADGSFHSGEALAQSLAISRASICNLVHVAQGLGLTIHAVRGRGYQLVSPPAWLNQTIIGEALGPVAPYYNIQIIDATESTNSVLMHAAESGAPDGSVVCAEYQFAGRGRRGRHWHSVLGGSLTFSVLWRFEEGIAALVGLSLAVGVAMARALNRFSRFPVKLKWPNDVLVDFRKLAGILVEIQGDIQGPSFAVVGIGLNVRLPTDQRESIDQAVVDLTEMQVQVDLNHLLASCLVELKSVMDVMRRDGFSGLRAEWEANHAHAGQQVSLLLPDRQTVTGIARGVDDTGAFLLQAGHGASVAYNSGDIRLRTGHKQ
ncbi:MAG: biotin--[acetyl-CoA-carboxylase] ligase [Thiobacillus sp.]